MKLRKICIIIMMLSIFFFPGCGSGRCCLKYDSPGNDSGYCKEHRDSVRKYLGSGSTIAERRVRIMNFESFLDKIRDFVRVSEIEEAIRSDYRIPGFWKYYSLRHNYAERNYGILKKIKARLIICGFKHGLIIIKKELKH